MYVHCHTKGCTFSQDDFWSWGYNPIRTLFREVAWLWRPRYVYTESRVFSWKWLAKCLWWRLSAPFTQKWWTYASWKHAIAGNGGKWPNCPKCGQPKLDVD
jgi:hypothetical protein